MSEPTFVFADLAGFTALTEAHGDAAAADLALEFCGAVTSWLEEFGGGTGKTLGDGLMLRVGDPAGAIELGLAIVERTSDTAGYPEVRVGMHTGPAVSRGGEWFGTAVNLASRVGDEASGREVLLTQATAEAAGTVEGVSLESLGPRRLRNLADPVVLLRARRAASREPDLVLDPVCRMTLRTDQPAETLVHGGREFRFCSTACRDAFARRPEAFIRP